MNNGIFEGMHHLPLSSDKPITLNDFKYKERIQTK